jgi:conjugative transposon TraM protein
MENKKRSEKFLRKRKMLMVMPLLIIPFLTIGFFALGGGQGQTENAVVQNGGLNLDLPSAAVKDEQEPTKLTFYKKVEEAERQREKELQQDSYFRPGDTEEEEKGTIEYGDPVEEKINRKIKLLEDEINRPAEEHIPAAKSYNKQFNGDVDRLEEMAVMMKEKQTDDPEMRQLDSMLEKILDVQNPERVRERMSVKSKEQSEAFFTVRRAEGWVPVSVMGSGLDTVAEVPAKAAYSIEAVVHETRSMVNGSVIKLRLVNDVKLGEQLIPKDHFVFGLVNLDGERLKVKVSSILFKNALFPVDMDVYDIDGLEGIYIPGSINRDVTKQSADNGLRLMEAGSLDQSFKAQVTAAGIGTAKNLLSKKIKLVKATVKAGYRVLLCSTQN